MAEQETLTKEEFCRRFKVEMLRLAGEKFGDGKSIADYADEIAPTYWEDSILRADGPEDAAEADLSYWED